MSSSTVTAAKPRCASCGSALPAGGGLLSGKGEVCHTCAAPAERPYVDIPDVDRMQARSTAPVQIFVSLAAMGLGLLLTVGSLAIGQGHGIVFFGLIIGGGIGVVRGLVALSS